MMDTTNMPNHICTFPLMVRKTKSTRDAACKIICKYAIMTPPKILMNLIIEDTAEN